MYAFLIITLFFFSSINLDLIFLKTTKGEEINSAISSQTNDNELFGKPTQVNVQVNLDKDGDEAYIYNILTEVERKGWNVTVYITGEFAIHHPGVVKDIHDRGHQIAVHGWQSGEDLTKLTYEQQYDLLDRAFRAVRTAIGESRVDFCTDFRPRGLNRTLILGRCSRLSA